MPKDEDYGITMEEAEDRTKELANTAEEKAEPQSESDIICHYYTGHMGLCPGEMGDERHYVIKNDNMVMAHKRCHKREQDGEKKTPNVLIR